MSVGNAKRTSSSSAFAAFHKSSESSIPRLNGRAVILPRELCCADGLSPDASNRDLEKLPMNAVTPMTTYNPSKRNGYECTLAGCVNLLGFCMTGSADRQPKRTGGVHSGVEWSGVIVDKLNTQMTHEQCRMVLLSKLTASPFQKKGVSFYQNIQERSVPVATMSDLTAHATAYIAAHNA
jgi:hypothetical protein